MLFRILLLFTLVPLLELALLIWIGSRVGTLPTVALVLVTGVVGAWLARREGSRTWREFRGALQGGRMPGEPLLNGLAILVGGAFLLTPGILTDLAGFVLLVPATRGKVLRAVRKRLERRLLQGRGGIEVRFWNRDSPGPPGPLP